MAHNKQVAPQLSVKHAERRAYRRHPVHLHASYSTGQDNGLPCEIRDLCIGGMYLVQGPQQTVPFPTKGKTITLRCAFPSPASNEQLLFKARIVRSDGRHCGIAFIDPDLSVLQRLLAHVRQHPQSVQNGAIGNPKETAARDAISLPINDLIRSCRELAASTVIPLARDFLESCRERIFSNAESIKDSAEKNAHFNALIILSDNGDQFMEEFSLAVQHRLDTGPATCQPLEQQSDPARQQRLALVEDDVFEDWLATTDMINHVETRNLEQLTQLAQRLGILFQTTIDSENNPFGAAAFAHAFQSTIKKLDLQQPVLQLCYSIFKQLLTRQGNQLYRQMNQLLIDHGVLPKLEYVASSPPAIKKDIQRQRTSDQSREDLPQTGEAGALHNEGSGTPIAAPNLYQVVDQLRTLQQAIRNQAGHSATDAGHQQTLQAAAQNGQPWTCHPENSGPRGAAPEHESAAHPDLPQYGATEILDALSALPNSSILQRVDGTYDYDYLTPIQSLLAERNGSTGVIAVRERNIMSVAGNIFQSLLQDMLIASNVKSWMQRLEIPLLKLALQDDSLFLDKNHVARQVVNKIAQLELYGRNDSLGSNNAIHRKIDHLLDQIAQQPEANSETFSRALKELEHLIQIQEEAYTANLKDLISACEQEQQLLGDPQLASPGGMTDDRLNHLLVSEDKCLLQSDVEEETQEWLRKVQRLKVGEWLLFREEGSPPQRLRLAWIGKHRDRYVFVNLQGLREATLTPEGLALRLSQQTALILENADDPALDRAQYDMLQNLHHQLLHETTHDQLTGLLNRREFERLTREALQGGDNNGRGHILCYLDLNQFDVINSRYGYEAGDQLLREITTLLQESINEEALLARLGGDDFAMLLKECTVDEAREKLQLLLDSTANCHFIYDGKHFTTSLSIGLVPLFTGISNITELLQAGESSCRIAQEKGNNHVHIYRHDDESLTRKQELLHWLSRVDEALESDTLELRCQPIVPITAQGYGKPHHSEILLAMCDEQGTPVSPEGFILAAEHYNRMPAIDRRVIRAVFHWMRENAPLLAETGGFAINLSGRSLNDDDFKSHILSAIRSSQVPVEHLCFEVTETAGINNLSSAADFILAVKDTGCSFSLDDFGSGMSSYGYLKKLPVDYLKIDGAFVKEMDKNPEDYAVVKSITEIGHFMGKKIIAEYVESEAILALLREIGVDYAQGYAVGKPRLLRELRT